MRGPHAILLCLLALAGCAAPGLRLEEARGPEARACAAWYEALDAQVAAAEVGDAQDARIPAFPYARVSRLLQSYRAQAAADPNAFEAWADRLMELDLAARRHEIANLPPAHLERLLDSTAGHAQEAALVQATACAQILRDSDLALPEHRAALIERARVPDDYSTLRRALGLYALTRHAFAGGVRRYEEDTLAAFRDPPRAAGMVVRYSPPHAPRPAPPEAVAQALRQSSLNALGIPEPDSRLLKALLAAHAPAFDIGITGDHDRFGALHWPHGGSIPAVDATEPAVYHNAAWTRYHGQTLLQLAYTIWFPERPADSPDDIYAGALDGLTWRVTLAPDGEPLVYDSIHPCGCYHLFFPTPRARALPPPDALEEWMFAPRSLARPAPGERPVLRIAPRTHFLVGVTFERAESLARYELRPYDGLRSLARPEGGRRSAFGPDGLIAGTERAERFLFWPMGIASAGAMRQWGRQATAFVGRRHFDDADLFEKRFAFDLR